MAHESYVKQLYILPGYFVGDYVEVPARLWTPEEPTVNPGPWVPDPAPVYQEV